MQKAEVVLSVLRERGRKGLPLTQLYRQMFNKELYLLAYGNIYSNQGAMTPGASAETADGMSEEKIDQITEAMRHERYRFAPARRTYIPKKNGKLRPLGLPSWSGKLVGEVVRLLLEAYYEPGFSDLSHGFRKGRGCHTALRKIHDTWTGTVWFIEGDISDCFGSLDHGSLSKIEFKEVQSYSRPIGRGVRTERPPVIGVENTPGFEMSDCALNWGAQPIYLGIEFLLPVKQFPALRLLKRGDEARALIALVADPAESSRHDICGFCLCEGCHVVIMPGNGLGYE